MKSYARVAAFTAHAVGVLGIAQILLSASPTRAMVTEPVTSPAPAVASWSAPDWFPPGSLVDVLPALDGPAVHANGPSVRARAAIVADLETGEVLWSHNADQRLPVASLTKVVSSLALMSTAPDLDATLCVTPEQWPRMAGGRSKFLTGSCHVGWDYLGAALVKSDNRGAMGLAALSGEPYHVFVERMTALSGDLGMTATWEDPAGLGDGNLASARDISKALVALAADPTLSHVASARSWTIDFGGAPRTLSTTNRLVDRWEVVAAKTGYTSTAGWCFGQVVRTKSGRLLATVVLGAPTNGARFRSTRQLVRWAEGLES